MKKVLLALWFLTFLGIYQVNAQTKYKVTVTVQITTVYYNDSDYYDEAFSANSAGTPQVIEVCADTPEEAKNEAKSECSTMCSRNSGRKLGRVTVNGKTYYAMEYREVYDASAQKIGSC
jgi:hypothetical protein